MKNAKHKLFADTYLANGMNATQAAISVGYKESNARNTACLLLEREDIKDYIKIKQNQTTAKLDITREKLIKDLEEDKKGARGEKQYSAAMKASEIQAKMLGLNEPEQSEIKVTGITPMNVDGKPSKI